MLIFVGLSILIFWNEIYVQQIKIYALILDYKDIKFDLDEIEKHCIITSYHLDKGKIYNCSGKENVNDLKIGIVSFHFYSSSSSSSNERYQRYILSNHLSYTIKHKYIYFEITDSFYPNTGFSKLTHINHNLIYKGQKPYILQTILSDFDSYFDYLVWIDFDAIFFNCSISIGNELIPYSNNMYIGVGDEIEDNMIFSIDWGTMINSGVIIFKNSEWTKNEFLKKAIYAINNIDKKEYNFKYYYNFRHWADQSVFISILRGFDPFILNKSYFVEHGENEYGKYLLDEMNIIKKQIETKKNKWDSLYNIMFNETFYINIHQEIIHHNLQKYVQMIPQMKINLVAQTWVQYKKIERKQFEYDPFIVHFAGNAKYKQFMKLHPFRDAQC